jgi:hypothetical protein
VKRPEQSTSKSQKPKTKAKYLIEWSFKLLFMLIGLIMGFLAVLFLIFENVETEESKEVQKWCAEYMPGLSVRACRAEAGL